MSFLSEDMVYFREERKKKERQARERHPYSFPLTPSEIERQRRAEKNRASHNTFPRLLQRYGASLQTSLSPTIHSALFQWREETPANRSHVLPTWCEENNTSHHPRSLAIEKALVAFQKADDVSKPRWLLCIDLLLGARLQEARAKAAYAFFNPEQHFFHTVSGMVTKFIQDKIAQNQHKNSADAYENLKICFQSYPLLEKALSELVNTYHSAFPFVSDKFNSVLKAWFEQGELQCSLMELFDNVTQKLSFPGMTLDTYTLEQFEQQAFFAERTRYEEALAQHLKQYPDDIALFLEAAQLGEDFGVSSTTEARQVELIQYLSFLPAQMPWAFSDYYLNQGHLPSVKLLDTFLAHGADIAHLPSVDPLFTPEAWPILNNALKYYCPQSPLDTLIRRKLQTYCQKPHEKARWLSIVEALSDKKAVPLAKRLLEACQNHEKYRSRSSQLLKAAREAQNYLQKPTLKPILLSFYGCFEKSEPWIESNTVSLNATTPWETLSKQLLPEITTLVVEASWFKTDNQSLSIQRLSSSFPGFKHLSFSNTGLTDDGLYTLMNVWGYIDNPRQNIETLDLSHNLITDEGLQKIASRLPWWPKLKTLNLLGNLITAEGVEALLLVLPKTTITTIHLSDTGAIDATLNAKLSDTLALNAQQLPALKLDSPDIVSETSDKTSLSASTPSDNSLSEENMSTSMEAENQMNEALAYMQTLTGFLPDSPHLNLSFATVRDIHFGKLLVYLQHRQAPLVSIHFDGQSVKNLTDEDFLCLIDALNRFPTLNALSFQQTELHLHEEEGYSSKLTLLKHYLSCPNLKDLDLRGNDFSTADIEMLTAFSEAQGSLQQVHVDTPLPLSPSIHALQTQLQKNQQQHEALVAITTQLNTQQSHDTLMPLFLTPPPLRTLRQTPIVSSTTKTWYHLLPVQGNTFLFDFSHQAFLRAEQQRGYFFKADADVAPLVPKSDRLYHDQFCGILYLLFTLAKEAKDDWSLEGLLAFPFEKIATLLSRLGSKENEVGFILYVADFLYQHYVYTGKAHDLTQEKALNDALTVMQWMHDNDTSEHPLVQLLIHQKLQVRHLSFLLQSCMGATPIIMAVPTAQLSQYDAMIEKALPPEAVFQNSYLPLLTLATPKPLTDVVSFEENALPEWIITFPENMPAEETCEATWSPVLQKLYQGRYPETVLTLRALIPTGKLTLAHIDHLVKAIPEGGKIRKLDANGMQFTPETWQAFGELISHWNHLKELHLENALYEGALQILAPVLEGLSRLTTLNISHNAGQITPEEMAIFLPKLPRCEELHSLHMSYNGLTDEMLDLLWRNLPCLKRLATIDLSFNQLTSDTVEQFTQQKSGVVSLKLDHNQIEETDINLAKKVCEANHAIKMAREAKEIEKWDLNLRTKVRSDAKDYIERHSKTPVFMRQLHGGTQSLAHAKKLVKYDEEKHKEDAHKKEPEDNPKLFYFLEYLKSYFLDYSISSMSQGALDTPIVADIAALFEQTESPLLEGFHEQLQALSTTDPLVKERARKNTPFYVNAFPHLFAEQYQRCLERARLGLSIGKQIEELEQASDKNALIVLQSVPRNQDALNNKEERARLERAVSELQKAQQDTHTMLAAQGKRMVTVTEDVEVMKVDITDLQQEMKEVKAQLAALEKKYELLDSAIQAIQQIEREASNSAPVSSTTYEGLKLLITNLQREQGILVDTLHTLGHQENAALATKLHTLQEKVERHGNILAHLRPSQRVELSAEKAAYVAHFQQTVFQLYLASLMISTGLFSYHSDGSLSKASNVLKSLGNIIPFAGSGMKLLSTLLKKVDKIVLERRMNRLRAMGGFFEVMALSERLAMKLFDIDLPNPLSEGLLGKLLNVADSLTAAEGATSLIQVVWQVVETTANDFISHLLAKPSLTAIEERAEQDANLFLTRLCQEGMPHRHALYLSATAEVLPRPETLVIHWIDANTLGCHLPDGRHIQTLNEAGLGRYYATLSVVV